jgi:hypothetical protein
MPSPSLNERLRQGLALAVVSAAATGASPALSISGVEIAQQFVGSQPSKGAVKKAPRPSSTSTSTAAKKEKTSSKKSPADGAAAYEGGCGPAQ